MAQKNINLGTGELTGDGESLRSALVKIEENFTDVYASAFSGDYNDLTNKPATDLTQVAVNILPDGSRDLGSPSANWDDVYAQKVWLNNSFAFQDQEVGGAGLKLSLLDTDGNKATLVADIEDYATETYVTNAVQALDDDLRVGTPGALDSLNELAQAINNDPNFATTVTSALALKADIADLNNYISLSSGNISNSTEGGQQNIVVDTNGDRFIVGSGTWDGSRFQGFAVASSATGVTLQGNTDGSSGSSFNISGVADTLSIRNDESGGRISVSTNGPGDINVAAGTGDLNLSGGNILIGTNADQTTIDGTTLLIGSTEDTSTISIGQHNINNTTTTNIYGDTIFRNSRSIEFVGSDITFSDGADPVKSPTVDFTNATVTGLTANTFGLSYSDPGGGGSTQVALTADIFDFGTGNTVDLQGNSLLFEGATFQNFAPGTILAKIDEFLYISSARDGAVSTNVAFDYDDSISNVRQTFYGKTSFANNGQAAIVDFTGATISGDLSLENNIAFETTSGPYADLQLDVVNKVYERVTPSSASGENFTGTFTNTPTTDWKLWGFDEQEYSISNVVDNGGGSYTITVPGYTFNPIYTETWFDPASNDTDNKLAITIDKDGKLNGVSQILGIGEIKGDNGLPLVFTTKNSDGSVSYTNMTMSGTSGARTTVNGTIEFDDAVDFNGATITGVDWNPIVASQIQANGLPSNTRFSQAAPVSSIGLDGDLQGAVTFDSNYIYYCTADYDGVTNIWKRVAWSGDTW